MDTDLVYNSVGLFLRSMAEADCNHPHVVTSSLSQQQQTLGDDPLLCPLQQHGTIRHQESSVTGVFKIQTQDSSV